MPDFEKLVAPHLRQLGAYVPGKPVRQAERESGVRCIKMASNENPLGPSPKAIQVMRELADQANVYPDNDATDLRALLAKRFGVKMEEIIVTDGSTPMLDIVARTLLTPGLNSVTSEGSFIVYPIVTRAAGADFRPVPMRGFAYDLDAIADAVDPHTRLVFLANPNNPTGTMFDADACGRFLDRMPPQVVVVLDEAYYDFGEYFAHQRGVTYSRSLDHVREGRNVVVLRTLSKGHGLAGMRVGYAFGPAPLLSYFTRVRTAFSVSLLAEAAAIAAIEDEAHMQRSLENNAAGAAYLERELTALGMKVVPTSANFIFFDTGQQAGPLAARIQENGVIVRPLGGPWGIPTGLRVTIGTPEQNQAFIAALSKSLQPAPVA